MLAALLWSRLSLAATWPDLNDPPVVGGGTSDAAVIVGIEDYTFVEDIPGALRNAEDWFVYLQRGRQVPATQIQLLRNTEATDTQIKLALQHALQQVKPGGTLWFVFIGHGAPSPNGGLLVGVDAQRSAVSINSRSLDSRAIIAQMESGSQFRTMVILDACFSGLTPSGGVLVENLQPMIPIELLPPRQVTVLTAAKSDQYAGPLPGMERPAFSYLLLGALQGWGDVDGDGIVTSSEATTYAANALYTTVRDRLQVPEQIGPDILLPGGNKRGPDLGALTLLSAPSVAGGGLQAELAALRKAQVLREQEERTQAAERQKRLDAARGEILSQAAADWRLTREVARNGGTEAEIALRKFINGYQDAVVRLDGEKIPVEVPEVARAQEMLLATIPPPNTHRALAWAADTALVMGGGAMLIVGRSQENQLQQDVNVGSVSESEWSERRGRINLIYTAGYAALGAGSALGVGLVVWSPEDELMVGWRVSW